MLDAYAPNYYTDYCIGSYEPPNPEYLSLEEFEEKRRN
jgi:hypothetical protein